MSDAIIHRPRANPVQSSASPNTGCVTTGQFGQGCLDTGFSGAPSGPVLKPTAQSLVMDLLVDSALHRPDSVEELEALQNDPRFQYAAGQRMLFASLLEAERKEFHRFEAGEKPSYAFYGCLAHWGEVFDPVTPAYFLARGPDSPALHKTPSREENFSDELCAAWMRLITDEFNYLARQELWNPDQRALARHACEVMRCLMEWWSRGDTSNVQAPEILEREGHAIIQATERLIVSPAVADIVNFDRSLEGAQLLNAVVSQAASLGDSILAEELIELLPSVFRVCQELCPEEFAPVDEEYFASLEAFVEDADYDEEQLDDLEDDEDLDYQKAVKDEWEFTYLIILEGFEILPEQAHRAEILIDILRQSPFDSPIWDETLDTLVSASGEALSQFLPELLERMITEPDGPLVLLSLADFSARTEKSQDPLPMLAKTLQKVSRSLRNELLREARSMLDHEPEIFQCPEVTREALKRLYREVKKPRR